MIFFASDAPEMYSSVLRDVRAPVICTFRGVRVSGGGIEISEL